MDPSVRIRVRERAGNRCEYCRAHQDDEPFYRYQIEHVIAKQHRGRDDESNLALACPFCNRHKGPNIAGLDPLDGTLVPLFHPREQHWDEHFAMIGPEIVGITAVGRATVATLNINDSPRLEFRATLLLRTGE